jgi:hypothetical protein
MELGVFLLHSIKLPWDPSDRYFAGKKSVTFGMLSSVGKERPQKLLKFEG